MNPLQQIPLTARKYLYLAYALVGLVLGGFQVYGVQDLGALDVGKALEVLAYVGIPLGFTAASNLPSYEDVVDGDVPPPDRGAADVVTILLVAVLVVVLLILLGVNVR